MLDCMVMLHFHIGSQITDIRKIKEAIREAGRVYAKLRPIGRADPLSRTWAAASASTTTARRRRSTPR